MGARILIAEDDNELRVTLEELLRMRGYDVVSASNGFIAWTLLREQDPPALVLLDLVMPQIDGWQLRGDMLRDPRLAAVPVIVMSAFVELPTGPSLQAARVLTKPFQWSDLVQAVEAVLGSARAEHPSSPDLG